MSTTAPIEFSPSRKRPLPQDDDVVLSTPQGNGVDDAPVSAFSSALSTPKSINSSPASPIYTSNITLRAASPTLSSNTSVSGDHSANPVTETTAAGSTGPLTTKRRKLTAQEKETKKLEKEAKDKERAEQKAKKDEEKRVKDEERRRKNEDKEEKRREKELEQQRKDEEKKKKDEEKAKKDKSQLKLNAFFAKPKPQSSTPTSPTKASTVEDETHRRKSVSLEPTGTSGVNQSRASSPVRKEVSLYHRKFLPYSAPSHTTVAKYNAYISEDMDLSAVQQRLDEIINNQGDNSTPSFSSNDKQIVFSSLSSMLGLERASRGTYFPSVKDLIALVQGSSEQPIDLTHDVSRGNASQPLDFLQCIPMKYLHFGEDVRPPYHGTFTRPQVRKAGQRLARNPFSRTLPEINYEYDSEAEWEEPEEGEDLDSEGEEDADSNDGGDDLDGFLDDEDAAESERARKQFLSADLVPVCSGICWETPRLFQSSTDTTNTTDNAFIRMEFLLDPYPTSINPYSSAYWQTEVVTTNVSTTGEASINGTMNPPRHPLQPRSIGVLNGMNSMSKSKPDTKTTSGLSGTAPVAPKAPKRLVPEDQLAAFKQEIEGSDLTKIAIIEALKKKFPKIPKDAIQNTLNVVAARVGTKDNKRWTLLQT
ncbi:hypothetical protein M501DRAFT_929079 [Patellaria atrata CBS 101060]|uniref:Chromatin assembly factor 1 subunit A n=1 Tax=Patellaria atrata CBS 101060 TaxID=1346257 RepID=A0A9P4SEX5_9PEZI|nr:hypothetical protein M501DRAFT_929079 [Patellaria atrata CBS 101060]